MNRKKLGRINKDEIGGRTIVDTPQSTNEFVGKTVDNIFYSEKEMVIFFVGGTVIRIVPWLDYKRSGVRPKIERFLCSLSVDEYKEHK